MKKLHDIIIDFKQGNTDSATKIIDMFDPLLNKLERQSNCCDIKSELTLFMIELLQKFPIERENLYYDKNIVSYISKSVKNRYIFLNKKACTQSNMESDLDLSLVKNNKTENNLDMIFFNDIINHLTPREQKIIKYKYALNYSDIEIASLFNISRQSVNKTKLRALNKLRLNLN